jgi:NodT family efflux transporter outer membrane factor (OMF) lipoprotein
MRTLRATVGFAAYAILFASCTVGPDFQRPDPAAEHSFADRTLGNAGPGDIQQMNTREAQVRGDWWVLLGSPDLVAVEREALARNWDLASRVAALARARQQLAGVRGENYPELNAAGQVGQTRVGATALGSSAYTFPIFSAYGAGLQASYDPDLVGGRRRRIEATAADTEAAAHELDAATLTLVANVALQAIQIAATRKELAIAEEIVAADQHTLDLVSSAHEVGAAPNTDVLQAAAQHDHDRALVPPYRQQLQTSEDVLATLVGRSPTDWSAPKFALSEFTLPASLPNTMPSVLARRRPDILAAEARLHAASANIGVADADLYPKLDLSAAVSRQGLLGGPSETAWSLIGGVSAPIFNGGRLIAAKRAAEANYRASFALYQDVVVTALGQVADALNALANDADTLAAQEDAFVSAKRSLVLNQEGYKEGSADLTRVLDTQRLLDQAEDGVTRAESARLADTVRLFFALGIGPPPDLDGTGSNAPR